MYFDMQFLRFSKEPVQTDAESMGKRGGGAGREVPYDPLPPEANELKTVSFIAESSH